MSNCFCCGLSNGYEDGGWLCLRVEECENFLCQICTGLYVDAWAREIKRQRMEKNPPPNPTNSPTGAGTVYVEELRAA